MNNDELPDQPKWMPYAVVSVWVLIGLITIIVVLSGNPNYTKAIELIVQLVSALGGAGAAMAAFFAVRQATETLKAAREDRERQEWEQRPNIVFVEGETGYLGNERCHLKAVFMNAGVHPTNDINVEATFVDIKLESPPELNLSDSIANNIPSGGKFALTFSDFDLEERYGMYYVIFSLHHRDSLTGKMNYQTIFLETPKQGFGFGGGLQHASKQGKRQAYRHLRRFQPIEQTMQKLS